MRHPLERDPILDESCEYHERARRQALRNMARYQNLDPRVYAAMEQADIQAHMLHGEARVRAKKRMIYFRRSLSRITHMRNYEQACAHYHLRMLTHWNNCQRPGYINPAVARVPQLPVFML